MMLMWSWANCLASTLKRASPAGIQGEWTSCGHPVDRLYARTVSKQASNIAMMAAATKSAGAQASGQLDIQQILRGQLKTGSCSNHTNLARWESGTSLVSVHIWPQLHDYGL